MLKDWKICILIYLVFSVIFNQGYKMLVERNMKDGTITILINFISTIFCVFLIPLFEFKYPKDLKVYFFLLLAIIFYTLNNRLSTISRHGIDASSYSVLKQLQTVFMILAGVIFFKETFNISKIIGTFLIVFSNMLVFYKKNKIIFDKYIMFGILANISLTLALFIDVNYSNKFNLPLYLLLISLISSILVFLVEKISIKDILLEYRCSNKKNIYLTSISWSLMMIFKLNAYEVGNVIIIAPISSLTVILNVIFGYIFLKERNNLINKIIGSILIVIGIILIG